MSYIVSASKRVGALIAQNSPWVLTAIGVGGVVSTAVLAVKATPEALYILQREEDKRAEDPENSDLSRTEVVKLTWRCYIPSALMGTATIACIISATSIGHRRNAALLSVYTLADKALTEYQEKIVETIGEKKADSIRDAIAQDHLDRNPLSSSNLVVTEGGGTICYDELSGRYFKSSVETIRRAENDLNHDLINGTWVSLNQFYSLLGLDNIKLGDEVGWEADNLVELKFSARLADNNEPCIVLDYVVEPKRGCYY